MNIPKKEVLSARLADDVNKKLNPDDPDEFHFSEFYFNEMVDIFNLPGIDQWPKTLIILQISFCSHWFPFLPQTEKYAPK